MLFGGLIRGLSVEKKIKNKKGNAFCFVCNLAAARKEIAAEKGARESRTPYAIAALQWAKREEGGNS